jgi:hypothetical protein
MEGTDRPSAEEMTSRDKALAPIVAILATVLLARGIYILSEIMRAGVYTIPSRYGPVDLTGASAILYGLGATALGAALMGIIPYLLWGRIRLTVILCGGFGLLAVLGHTVSLFAPG